MNRRFFDGKIPAAWGYSKYLFSIRARVIKN
jgi:hypothetical protein